MSTTLRYLRHSDLAAFRPRCCSIEGIGFRMSNNPPYPPPGGYPQGPPPGYGQQGPPIYSPPGQPAYGTPYAQPGFGPPSGRSKRWYQRWWVWLIIVIALLIIAAVAFGVNHASGYQLASKIKDEAKTENVPISNVKCPDTINTDKGHTYSCTAIVNGKASSLRIVFVADKRFTIQVQ
jgi:Domain of unknown function (DUF4333)